MSQCEHPQSVSAYCVPDDDASCIRFESDYISPDRLAAILQREGN